MGKGIIRQAELGYVNPFVPLMSTCRERVLERPRPVPSPERGHERELAQDVHSSRSHQQDVVAEIADSVSIIIFTDGSAASRRSG
jgi:hypothetical protein